MSGPRWIDGKPTKSLVSMMPKGLLDKLTRAEILDLVAYIAAKGMRNINCSRANTIITNAMCVPLAA